MSMFKKQFLTLLILVPFLCSCGGKNETNEEGIQLNYRNNTLNVDVNESQEYHFDFHDSAQSKYLASGRFSSVQDYAVGDLELSKPVSLKINFAEAKKSVTNVKNCYIDVSESESFTSYKRYETDKDVYSLKNFLSNFTYYLKFTLVGDNTVATPISKLITKPGIRNIDIGGVTNVRDIGGFENESGKIVKQGLYYRGGRLNENSVSTLQKIVTEEGINDLKELGIKTEIDLRNANINEPGAANVDGVVDDITYANYSMDYNSDILTDQMNMTATKNVFTLLSDETNYPVYVHCSIGTDRTGFISFLLAGLLGANNEQVFIDYLFSNFGAINSPRNSSAISEYIRRLNLFSHKDTLAENIESYLINTIGVTKTQIDSIKNIFVEK